MKGVLDSAIDCIISMDEQGLIVEFNAAAEKMFGYARAEVLGLDLAEVIIPPALREPHRHGLRQRLDGRGETGLQKRVETIGMRADGSEFPVELSITEVPQRGSLLFSGFIRDISEHKRAEMLLQEKIQEAEQDRRAMLFMLEDLNESSASIIRAKKEWEQTFDAVTNPIFVHDKKGYIVRANKAYAARVGKTFKEITGKPYWQVFPKRNGQLLTCLLDKGKTVKEEIQTQSGAIFLSQSYSIHGDGEAAHCVHFLEDITERKLHAQIIRDNEERFRAIGETAQDAIIMLNNDGRITLWNRSADKMFGYAQDEAMGRKIESLIIPKRFRKRHQRGFAMFRDSGQGPSVGRIVELQGLHKNGTEFPIELSISAAMLGKQWHVVGMLRDITERKRAENKLIQSHKMLQQSLEGTIQAIAAAAEVRDPYTAGHQNRVAELACAIAQEMGLQQEQIVGIHMGGKIHDIGKINLPAEILSKPTRLTQIEYALIQGHSQVGYGILKDIYFPWPVADIVHQHHERIDGTGYPQGLKGEEICLEARIVAVADVVEAMNSHRPYRAGLGIDKALDEIEQGSGSLYDSDVASACRCLFHERGFIITDSLQTGLKRTFTE